MDLLLYIYIFTYAEPLERECMHVNVR